MTVSLTVSAHFFSDMMLVGTIGTCVYAENKNLGTKHLLVARTYTYVPRALARLVLKPLQPRAADRAWRFHEVELVVQVKPDGEQDRPDGDNLYETFMCTRKQERGGRI